MRDLSIAGKITVFKTLAISKIVHFALVKVIPNSVIYELGKKRSISYGKMAILNLNRAPFVQNMKMVA